MRQADDLTGKKFGFLEVVGKAPDKISPSGKKYRMWECKCNLCGNKKTVCADDLRRGDVKSCGCLASYNGAMRRAKKICVICGKEFDCSPSRNIVTCSHECKIKYLSKNHKGLKHTLAAKNKMSDARLQNPKCAELQKSATDAAKKSPKSGRFTTNVHAIDWHLVSPDGKDYYFHSLNFWMRENCKELFGFEPDSKQFYNAVSGLERVKRSMLGKLPDGQRPGYSYKGWRVIPTDIDYQKNKGC